MFDFRGLLTGRDRAGLPPGERALPFHLAPVIVTTAGALMILAAMFMPALQPNDGNVVISGNTVIESYPWLLLCSVAAVVAAARYWRSGSRSSANLAVTAGVLFLVLDVFEASTAEVYIGSYKVAGGISAALGLWTVDVGCLLVALGGLMMRYPQLSFGLGSGAVEPRGEQAKAPETKVCPRCAETVKVAATVCRFCGLEFDQSEPVIADRSKSKL